MLRNLAVVRGWPQARATLRTWQAARFRVAAPWIVASAAIGGLLLTLTYLIATQSPPDPEVRPHLPGSTENPTGEFIRHVFLNNLEVLALHTAACLATFITHDVLRNPEGTTGTVRAVERAAAFAAMAFVPAATIFSLATQAWILGSGVSDLSNALGLPNWLMVATVLPHAIPELIAVFLPLAAWLVMSRRGGWDDLLAATVLTTLVALPVVAGAAVIEGTVWSHSVRAAQAQQEWHEWKHLGQLIGWDGLDHSASRYDQAYLRPSGKDRRYTSVRAGVQAIGDADQVIAIVRRDGGYLVQEVWVRHSSRLAAQDGTMGPPDQQTAHDEPLGSPVVDMRRASLAYLDHAYAAGVRAFVVDGAVVPAMSR